MEQLLDMLTYRRPAGSKTERKFIAKYVASLDGMQSDSFGNLSVRIGSAPIMWSCHTDTVHKIGGQQAVQMVEDVASVGDKGSNCLGADDTAGVYLMREMILARRPGLYVFHRAEEIGGVGSSHIAARDKKLLEGIDFAVALDRRGYSDVITHQAMGRCCSDAFADSLSSALGMKYKPSDHGIFTDTANYVDLIGECTNVSVGYFSEHTKQECLDLEHVAALRESLLRLDARQLELSRKPGEVEEYYRSYGKWESAETWDSIWDQELVSHRDRTLFELVRNYPDEIADILLDYGLDYAELYREIKSRRN